MSEERKCTLHGDQAESWCLYHIELMCVKCKFDSRHYHCPKDTIPAKTEFPITDFDKRNLYQKCRDIYTTAIRVENETSSFSKTDLRKVQENLDTMFRNLGDRIKSLQEDATSSVHETKEMCLNNCTEFQSTAGTVLTSIGKLMKELCGNTVDVARIEKLAKDYKDEADTKLKHLERCDMKYRIGLRLACLLDPDNIATSYFGKHVSREHFPPSDEQRLRYSIFPNLRYKSKHLGESTCDNRMHRVIYRHYCFD